MELVSEPLPEVKIFRPFVFEDARGFLVKTFHEEQLAAYGTQFSVREEFFSNSKRNVLRGMHFQLPPQAHQKIVFCIKGRVLDVLLDLRRASPTFGRSCGFELSATNRHIVYIPVGFAHGFLSMEDNSCLIYKTDSVHAADCDAGIRWDSFGFNWPVKAKTLQLSMRDAAHPSLNSFNSPF